MCDFYWEVCKNRTSYPTYPEMLSNVEFEPHVPLYQQIPLLSENFKKKNAIHKVKVLTEEGPKVLQEVVGGL